MYEIVIGRDEEDRKKYGIEGTVLIGKHYVKMGQTTSLSNEILIDVARSHVVFVVGKRGTGKCLSGETLITLDNGSEIPISELENNENNVIGLDKELKIKSLKKDNFFKRSVKELIYLKLRSGREIKLTPEHPLLTVRGWISAKNLPIGSKIATPRKINCSGNNLMKENEIKILAYLIAEGHTKRPILFSNTDLYIIEDLKQALLEIDNKIELTELQRGCFKINSRKIKRKVLGYKINRNKQGRFEKGSRIYHEKTLIRLFLEKFGLYGLLAKEKFIPREIFKLSKEQLALFLNRLFSCDGCICSNKKNKQWETSYSSSSEKLIKQVQSLLLRFSISSRLRSKKIKFNGQIFDSYELAIYGDNVIKFIKDIGFFGEKRKKQEVAIKDMQNIKRNPNIDTVPKEIWDFYRPKNWADVGKYFNYKTPKALRSSIEYCPSRQKLLQIAIADNNEKIRLLAESDIFWDEIISMEKLEGNFTVYDISVPEFHNFVANNIIVHNSYSMGVIAEGITNLPEEIKKNLSVIMLDTMGIYWTMKYPNKKDKKLLDEWGLEAKGLNVQIFTPTGYFKKYKEAGIPTDFAFSIKTNDLDASDWCMTFSVSINDPLGVLIERVIDNLKETKKDYDIDNIIEEVKKDTHSEEKEKNAAINRFLSAKKWGLFSKEGTLLKDLVLPGQITVLDVSCYTTIPGTSNIRALVIGLVAEKLFIDRMVARKKEEFEALEKEMHLFAREEEEEKKEPLVWLFVDEAHEFLSNEGTTTATQPLITVLREGRQPGISLVLASQQPGKIHTDVMTQADIVIAHRVTANIDVQALGALMQTYMRAGLDKELNILPTVPGAAIIFDDINEKMYPMRVRPRLTWHGGEAPSAILKKKEIFAF